MDGIDSPLWRERLSGMMPAEQASRLMRGLHEPAAVSVRLNPFKRGAQFADASPVPWSSYGRILSERPSFTLDPMLHAGAYYVQDSSAMFVGHVFRRVLEELFPDGGVNALDLCAAPGGKTTDMAASMRMAYGDAFTLTANEVVRRRAAVLEDNVTRWGDPQVRVISVAPAALGRMAGCFDIILADVPCSGEGMFRKDPQAVHEWSPEVVEMCAERQRRIIADVWPALRDRGVLLYSTCTFEEAENDGAVRWICGRLGGEPLTGGGEAPFEGIVKTTLGYLLMPGFVPGEGQYVAALRKTGGTPAGGGSFFTGVRNDGKPRAHNEWRLRAKDNPGRKDSPDPDRVLRIDFNKNDYPCIEVDRRTALRFLHGDSLSLPDAPRGRLVLCFRSLPLGLVNNIGSRCNNLLPARRRILMDINDRP